MTVIGDRIFHSNQGWFDDQGVAHGIPRFRNNVYPSALSTSRGVVVVGVNSPLLALAAERDAWAKVPLLDFGAWPPRATQPRVSATGSIAFAQSGPAPRGPTLYDFAPDGAPLAACPFTISPGEGLEATQGVVELPGLVVLVDSGRRVVWAYRR
jgi:hypothetical protein